MAKVTSKLQITLPKALAEEFGIQPGDPIEWRSAGEVIHLVPKAAQRNRVDIEERLASFDQATRRQRSRQRGKTTSRAAERGWAREELYDRGRTR
jgi:AbrB family looped-hinge helix DNA binding protein